MAEVRHRGRRLGAWALVLVVAAAIFVARLEFSYDLGLFLPGPSTAEQTVLLERLGDGPGSRFIMAAVRDDHPTIALEDVRDTLAEHPAFERVLTDSSIADMDEVPEPLWEYRFLLDDVDLSGQALTAALALRIAELGIIGGGRYGELVRADPVLASLGLLEGTQGGANSDWRTEDDRRVLLAETRAPAFRLGEQAQAFAALESAFSGYPAGAVEISGVGVFGIQLRDTIHAEAQLRSTLASLALALVLVLAYRRFAPLWLAAVPLATGMLVGLAVTALVFGRIHGITLAFGFTLLGIAIDYPLHLLSHARRQPTDAAVDAVWPTLRLGAASTMIAYLAIAVSGSEGLAQLGIFTFAGIAAAAAATRWVLPALAPGSSTHDRAGAPSAPRLRFAQVPVLLAIAGGILALRWGDALWNDDLSALSPIPEERLARDGQLRQALGAPDLRYLLVQRDPSLPALLERAQVLDDALPAAVAEGWISSFRSASTLLPGENRFHARQDALPTGSVLREAVARATEGTPFSTRAFEPFIEAVERSRALPPLTREAYVGSPLESLLDQLLYRTDRDWVSVVALYDPGAPQALADWLHESHLDAQLVDLQRASQNLVVDYRERTFAVLAGALVLITVLLAWRTRARRAAWAITTMLACMGACATLVFAVSGPLNLYHLIGLLLVGGLGLDYALFLSRPADAADAADSRHAVWACAASTFAAFGMLALSAIPALEAMGTTVAIGTGLNVLAARAGLAGASD